MWSGCNEPNDARMLSTFGLDGRYRVFSDDLECRFPDQGILEVRCLQPENAKYSLS